MTKEEIVERIKVLAQDAENAPKDELNSLKQNFYKILNAEKETINQQAEEIADKSAALEVLSQSEQEFKAQMKIIRDKKAVVFAKQEEEKKNNLVLKSEIIEKLKALNENGEECGKHLDEFKTLQQQWNETGQIPAEEVTNIWKQYQLERDKFYDNLKINNEMREYDFKKNLEVKTRLCEQAEKLTTAEDVVSAFHQLQDLHQQYRETGSVAKEVREELWSRFKEASTIINRRHQNHFDEIKQKENENLEAKTAICEAIESINLDELKSYNDWEDKTKEVLELQAKWKTIGFAPQKMNTKIFERFRLACNNFFDTKAQNFKSMKETASANKNKKLELCEKAEALKDSTDWKETSAIMAQLQKEWKEIGPTNRKDTEHIWKRFIAACDHFYKQKNDANAAAHSQENENLEKKQGIIASLKEILESGNADGKVQDAVQKLSAEWNSIGHVPFAVKDETYKAYKDVLDEIYKKLNINRAKQRLDNFKNNIKNSKDSAQNERYRLERSLQQKISEMKQYENNLGFLTLSSKKGNSLISGINRKVENLKQEIELIKQKISVLKEQE
ncbi:MAG: DUF349 domain-containing protein [Bacteroidaceae bacterium]|nr:DUF349 domain-containing protein [Bacteroidaceae bacterium]MBQ4461454.1 DUF349 domain-containing protein [Bacteroidaceae bacterium]